LNISGSQVAREMSTATPSHTGGGDNQVSGGSFKIIVDTEDWDRSVGLNSQGQSGDVNNPHYRDLYELWARGKYFPIFYSRTKIESVTEKTFELKPSTGAISSRSGPPGSR
jgi:penicillin amidase